MERVERFLDLLSATSDRMNLTGPIEKNRLWPRHVLESVAYAPCLDRSLPVTDVGTGAGFPGIILSMLGFTVTMVEPRSRRCGFLSTACRELGLEAEVLNSRIESCKCRGRMGTQFTSRAVGKPMEMIGLVTKAASGDFILVTRVSLDFSTDCVPGMLTSLPSPPLDRGGFLLQYRHSADR